jgi:hypothetical protein
MRKVYAVFYVELGDEDEPQEEQDFALSEVKAALEDCLDPDFPVYLEDVIISAKRG